MDGARARERGRILVVALCLPREDIGRECCRFRSLVVADLRRDPAEVLLLEERKGFRIAAHRVVGFRVDLVGLRVFAVRDKRLGQHGAGLGHSNGGGRRAAFFQDLERGIRQQHRFLEPALFGQDLRQLIQAPGDVRRGDSVIAYGQVQSFACGGLGFHKPVLRQIGLRKIVIDRHQATPVRGRVCAAVVRVPGVAFQRAGLPGVAGKFESDLCCLFQGSLRLDRLARCIEDVGAAPLELRNPTLPRVEVDVVVHVLGSLVEIRYHRFCLVHSADRQVGAHLNAQDGRQHQSVAVFL